MRKAPSMRHWQGDDGEASETTSPQKSCQQAVPAVLPQSSAVLRQPCWCSYSTDSRGRQRRPDSRPDSRHSVLVCGRGRGRLRPSSASAAVRCNLLRCSESRHLQFSPFFADKSQEKSAVAHLSPTTYHAQTSGLACCVCCHCFLISIQVGVLILVQTPHLAVCMSVGPWPQQASLQARAELSSC